MKKTLSLIILCGSLTAAAQTTTTVETVLKEIEQNNLSLQAAREELKAEVLDGKAENNLSDPSVEYIRQYSKNTPAEEDELVVTQEFDFPTAYAARSKYNKQAAAAGQARYEAERRNVLLEAKQLCLDLIGLNREEELIKMLSVNADSLVQLFDKQLETGNANALEANRAKLELMELRSELADNAAAHRTALQKLLAMNANKYLPELGMTDYPTLPLLPDYETLRDEILASHKELQVAAAECETAKRAVKVERAGWLPKLAVGYRRNTSPDDDLNGFIVGASLPIFENRHKVKAARARSVSAELRHEEQTMMADVALQSLYNEVVQVKEAMDAYDLPLIDNTFILLAQALRGGEMTWHEYYSELETLVRRKQSYLQLENRYHKLMAEIYADKL